MRQRAIGRDTELTLRMFLTMFLLAVVYLGFMFVLFAVGIHYIFIIVIAGVLLFFQYWTSDKLALMSMRAHVVSEEQEPHLHAMVERLSVMIDMPKPRVAVSDLNIPNAFATGRNPKKAVVAVTRGLMSRLNQEELEAVLAHELTHVKNRDVAVITLASFFATVASFIMHSFMWSMMFGGMGMGYGGRGRGAGGAMAAMMVVFLAAILTWIISFFLIRALSRYREYAADRGCAVITGRPQVLATALVKISDSMTAIPKNDLRRIEAMNAFFFVPALKGDVVAELLATHPPISKRIERLDRIQRELEGL